MYSVIERVAGLRDLKFWKYEIAGNENPPSLLSILLQSPRIRPCEPSTSFESSVSPHSAMRMWTNEHLYFAQFCANSKIVDVLFGAIIISLSNRPWGWFSIRT